MVRSRTEPSRRGEQRSLPLPTVHAGRLRGNRTRRSLPTRGSFALSHFRTLALVRRDMIDASRRVVIEDVHPQLDCGRYAIKREVGDTVEVSADIFKEGHDAVAAAVRYRPEDEEAWRESRMRFVDNDRW